MILNFNEIIVAKYHIIKKPGSAGLTNLTFF
jgi:hypothetical protein